MAKVIVFFLFALVNYTTLNFIKTVSIQEFQLTKQLSFLNFCSISKNNPMHMQNRSPLIYTSKSLSTYHGPLPSTYLSPSPLFYMSCYPSPSMSQTYPLHILAPSTHLSPFPLCMSQPLPLHTLASPLHILATPPYTSQHPYFLYFLAPLPHLFTSYHPFYTILSKYKPPFTSISPLCISWPPETKDIILFALFLLDQ